MAVTILDCLKLPALRGAEIVAGKSGLNQEISTVSVLEYARVFAMAEQLFLGNELILTAFVSVMDDVDAQCAAIRRMHEVGEAGIVLYYVGYYLKSIDPKLIATADELGFPMIVMPPNDYHRRYSEVITEVLEVIVEDRKKEKRFAGSLLNQITKMRERQRNIAFVLRVLSDRIHYSLLLVDKDGRECGLATWPMAENEEFVDCIRDFIDHNEAYPQTFSWQDRIMSIQEKTFDIEMQQGMRLFAIGEGELDRDYLAQAVEVLQASYSIWSKTLRRETASDLVRAILNGQKNEIERLADNLLIDLKKIRVMWVIRGRGLERGRPLVREKELVKEYLSENQRKAIVDTFDNGVVAFMDNARFIDLDKGLCQNFWERYAARFSDSVLIWCGGLDTIQSVRLGYILIEEYFETACTLYPHKQIFTLRELAFAKECYAIAYGNTVDAYLSVLFPLRGRRDEEDVLETLTAFLVDADKNTARTAAILHIHESTVKYRLNKAEQCLGYDVSEMPGTYQLYLALSIRRLLKQKQ